MENYYSYLIGKKIKKIETNKDEIIFITDEERIHIERFVPYCCCNVGEYIDEIFINGNCNGIITDIKPLIKEINTDEDYDSFDDTIYRGEVGFFFENGKIDMKVHGEDNGYYGVAFRMPVYIEKIKD